MTCSDDLSEREFMRYSKLKIDKVLDVTNISGP